MQALSLYQYRIWSFYDHGDVWCDGTCRIPMGNAGADSHPVFTWMYTWKSGSRSQRLIQQSCAGDHSIFRLFAWQYLEFWNADPIRVAGIFIGVSVVILSGSSLFLLDRFVARGDGVAGVAASSTAGAAVAVPYALAEANASFAPVAESATAIIATSVIVTSLLTPLATVWVDKKIKQKKRRTPPPKNQMTIN